jgi:hypothetical protein
MKGKDKYEEEWLKANRPSILESLTNEDQRIQRLSAVGLKLVEVEEEGLYTTENLNYKPTAGEIESLQVNDYVKVATNAQRFWVIITKKTPDGTFYGKVDSRTGIPSFDYNDKIKFKAENIYDILRPKKDS